MSTDYSIATTEEERSTELYLSLYGIFIDEMMDLVAELFGRERSEEVYLQVANSYLEFRIMNGGSARDYLIERSCSHHECSTVLARLSDSMTNEELELFENNFRSVSWHQQFVDLIAPVVLYESEE